MILFRSGERKRTDTAGFTLVELMIVVVIIGILSALASSTLDSRTYSRTVQGYGDEIVASMTTARMRAASSRKHQRLVFDGDMIAVYESQSRGLGPATGWDLINTLSAPAKVRVMAVSYRAHLLAGDSVPAAGANLPGIIDFAPDGTATAGTIFLSDNKGKDPLRVYVYRASGSSYLRNEW